MWKEIREDCRGNEDSSNRKGPGAGVCGRVGGTEGDQCGWSRVRKDDTEARPSQALGAILRTWWFSWRETEGLKQRMP